MERDSSVGETYRNILIYAAAIVGNERLLAERLGVNPQQVPLQTATWQLAFAGMS